MRIRHYTVNKNVSKTRVKEVKKLNGSFTFDDAVSWQKGWEKSE